MCSAGKKKYQTLSLSDIVKKYAMYSIKRDVSEFLLVSVLWLYFRETHGAVSPHPSLNMQVFYVSVCVCCSHCFVR